MQLDEGEWQDDQQQAAGPEGRMQQGEAEGESQESDQAVAVESLVPTVDADAVQHQIAMARYFNPQTAYRIRDNLDDVISSEEDI